MDFSFWHSDLADCLVFIDPTSFTQLLLREVSKSTCKADFKKGKHDFCPQPSRPSQGTCYKFYWKLLLAVCTTYFPLILFSSHLIMISGMFSVSKAKKAASSRQQLHLLLNKKKCALLAKLYKDGCTICTVRLETAATRHIPYGACGVPLPRVFP